MKKTTTAATTVLTTRVGRDVAQALKAIARRDGKSVSKILQQLALAYCINDATKRPTGIPRHEER